MGAEPMDEVSVRIRLAQIPDPAQRDEITETLLSWAAVASGGAYAVAPVPPLSCNLLPDMTVEWVDEEASWALAKVRVHAGAFRGLVNVVAALDQRGIAVAELEIA
jgi:hypothetical protein